MTKRIALADTGPLVAILNERDQDHDNCTELLKEFRFPLLTCLPVLTEVSHLVRGYTANLRPLLAVSPRPFLQILPLDLNDVHAALDIVDRFDDQGFDFADACLMHLAEREGIDTVFTLDEPDFSVFRTTTGKALQLVG